MKKSPLRISAVSYINAKPFVYGIENSGFLKDYSLSLDIPSVCAEKLISGKADIGLAPVTIIPQLKEHYIVPDFCIGSNGPVRTVMLYSDVPLRNIRSIYLDYQSKTSVILLQILAKHWWKIAPTWIPAGEGYEKKIRAAQAGLIIGDRNFSLSGKFKYEYDLSEEWKLFTGQPFVFACWIANKKPDASVINAFHDALKFGIENRAAVIKMLKKEYDENTMIEYLNSSIDYCFDKKKQEALDLFLKLGKEIATQHIHRDT